MLPQINQIKGVHPGQVLERELKRLKLNKSAFALSIGEYPSIISEITRLKRGFSASIALKIEEALNAEEGYFLVLQAYHEAKLTRNRKVAGSPKPDMSKIRPALFWDINPDKMDFYARKRFVIERVFERGNKEEISEIIRFYGREDCISILKTARTLLQSAVGNAEKYLGIKKEEIKCFNTSTRKPPQKPYF